MKIYEKFDDGFTCFKCGMIYTGIVTAITVSVWDRGLDWCPTLPSSVYTFSRNVCLIREYVPILTSSLQTYTLKGPILEELIFGFCLQEMILKIAPKTILNRFLPAHMGIVDSRIAKMARMALRAAAFSLAHANSPKFGWPDCSMVKLINTFVLGLICGGVQEATGSNLMAMSFHIGFNLPYALLFGKELILECPST